ncbi:unnamed protein product [Somion occarium]|uniref:Cohesin subunit rad21 n=1 Tax=Somion occarium TaxID=3059160 RepID=A0ABP1DHZ0_9APHY
MFYSEAILSRRGPLAKVWLAAHMERKLSKTQTLQTDIEQSVDAIMDQEVEVMALRLSGQLLLGVVRIYSRKAKYLLDDCNEALLKIKMAFKPGIVDMTEDQLAVNRNAITLQDHNLDLDALLPDINWNVDFENRVVQPGGQHIARTADITLTTADDFQYDFDEPNYGFDLGPSDGIGSQDYDIDLGLDFGDGPASAVGEQARTHDEDESMDVEYGRDAASMRHPRESLESHILGPRRPQDLDVLSYRSREASEHPFGDDLDFGPALGEGMELDLGLDFGDRPASEAPKTPQLTPSRQSSPLSEPPVTPPPEVELTPHVDIETGKEKRKPKEKKQIIDSVTELADGPGARLGRGRGAASQPTADVSNILTEHPFLPRSSLVMRLMEIREDPLSHFLPTKVTPNGTFFVAAPPGLAPELTELFMRPVSNLAAQKRRASPEKNQEEVQSPSKRARIEGSVIGDEEEIEEPRRAGSRAPSIAIGSEALGGRPSIGPGLDFADNTAGLEDFQMEIPEFELPADIGPEERARSKSVLSALSRMSTPALEEGHESYADVKCPIAIFDERSSSSQETSASSDDGYSRNTVKALSIIRRELQPTAEGEEKVLSFKKMAEKASKRAAASFFFEVLLLSTRDAIKVSQDGPFENIEIRAKDKLWERQRHSSFAPSTFAAESSRLGSVRPSQTPSRRQGSVTPSIASTFGL